MNPKKNDKDNYILIIYKPKENNDKKVRIFGKYIVKKAFRLMNIEDKHYSTHTLRHTAATLLYMYVREDTLLLKKFLGHESISSTEIYTHIQDLKVKDAVERNPLSNFIVETKR